MSLRRSEALGLGLSRQHLALQGGAPGAAVQSQPLAADAEHPPGAAALQAALAALLDTPAMALGQRPGRRLTAVFASDLARHWLVQAPGAAASLAEIRAVAQARFEAVHGCSANGWLICGDWRSSGPFLCAAIPQGLADALASGSANLGLDLQLTSTLGGVLGLHAEALPDDGCLLLRLPEHQMLIGARGGQMVALRSWRARAHAATGKPAEVGPWDDAVAELKREQLRSGLPLPGRLGGLDLSTDSPPPAAASAGGLRIDAIASRLPAAPPLADTGAADATRPAAWAGALAEARLAARIGAALSQQQAGRWA